MQYYLTEGSVMGIRKQILRQFYFYFCCRKGQIRRQLWKTWKLLNMETI